MSRQGLKDPARIDGLTRADRELIDRAGALSRQTLGNKVGFFVPGMFVYDGRRGRFPALSLTGPDCALNCEHCRGKLLADMLPVARPGSLLEAAKRAQAQGMAGLLVSGGCDAHGRLDWAAFADDLARIKAETSLFLSVHAGFVDQAQAEILARAKVDLAMIDVMGDDETARKVYHLPGRARVEESLNALAQAGLAVAPHVVVGLDYSRIAGEEQAVEMIARAGIGRVVFVVLMPLKGTGLEGLAPVAVEEVIRLLARTRLERPEMVQHLGCAKPRGAYHRRLDMLALAAGVNRVAIPAPAAVDLAPGLGLTPFWAETCCTAGDDPPETPESIPGRRDGIDEEQNG